MSFKTMADVRRANRAASRHFFDPEARRSFQSRVESTLYAGRYFITSEVFDDSNGVRRYSVREVRPDGSVTTHEASFNSTTGMYGGRGRLRTIEEAREAARKLAREVRK